MVFRAPSLPSARQGSDRPVLKVLLCLVSHVAARWVSLALLSSLGSPCCSPEAALAAPQDKPDGMVFIMIFAFPCSSWF